MLGCSLLKGKNTFLFVCLRFSLYSLAVRNEHCRDEKKTWLSYEREVRKADSPGGICCKYRAAFWADSSKLCDLRSAQREACGSLKRHPHRFHFLAMCMQDPVVFLASTDQAPAISCRVKHDGRMCHQPGEPEIFLRREPAGFEETVRKHHPRKLS